MIIALLAADPLRLANSTAQEIGRTIIKDGTTWSIHIPPEETKAHRLHLAILPDWSARCIDRYVQHYRTFLLNAESMDSVFKLPGGNGVYEIPLGAVTSVDTANLFAAGRTADGDQLAGASLRVMGTAFATGQACGVAAARYAHQADPLIAEIQTALREQGALIGATMCPMRLPCNTRDFDLTLPKRTSAVLQASMIGGSRARYCGQKMLPALQRWSNRKH